MDDETWCIVFFVIGLFLFALVLVFGIDYAFYRINRTDPNNFTYSSYFSSVKVDCINGKQYLDPRSRVAIPVPLTDSEGNVLTCNIKDIK